MGGSIIDLNQLGLRLPDAVLLDTRVVVARFLPRLRTSGPALAARRAQVASLLEALSAQGSLPFVATASFADLIHLVIRAGSESDRKLFPNPTTGGPHPDWTSLDKQRPALVRRYVGAVERLRLALDDANISVLQPADLGPIGTGLRIEQELIGLVRR